MQNRKIGLLGGTGGLLICLLLLLPSYFINNGNSHDWGGDFSMYISQAENIVKGMPQSDNGYMYNPECPGVGPPTYPIGFPLLLSPVIALVGNNMETLIDFLSVLFILFGLMVFIFLRSSSGFLLALVGALTLAYHPSLLVFKREVMSDVPFVLFALLSIHLWVKKKWVWAGLLMAFCASIRTVGVSLILATVILLILDFLRSAPRSKNESSYVGIGLAILGYFVINHWLFSTNSESGYQNVFALYNFQETIIGNVELYWDYTHQFLFSQTGSSMGEAAFLLVACLAILGWLRKMRSNVSLTEIWLPIYLLVLAVYPYRGGALRFILPVLPFLFYYAGMAIKNRSFFLRCFAFALLCVPMVTNAHRTIDFAKNWPEHLSGPQSLASVELFEHVKDNVPKNEAILFLKPRVLALYTGRNSMSNERKQAAHSIKAQLDTIPIQHLLTCAQIWNPGIDSVIAAFPDQMELEFENYDFKLYRYVGSE